METESRKEAPADPTPARRVHWSELEAVLDSQDVPEALVYEEGVGALHSAEIRIVLPRVLTGSIDADAPVASLREALDEPLGRHLVLLMQAGAVSIGLFDEGLALETRTLKKYTVRARGKAQTTWLERRGKSRYGSRLRLQNARSLLRDTNAKIQEWLDVYGHPERLFYAAPVRLWPELFQPRAHPALPDDAGWVRIPRDLPVPTTRLLLQVYEDLCHGSVEERSTR